MLKNSISNAILQNVLFKKTQMPPVSLHMWVKKKTFFAKDGDFLF